MLTNYDLLRYKLITDDLTITFSGRNIKEFLYLAINSFLDIYPDLKKNIIVFDDNSTDGTKEMLKSLNIKRITWKKWKDFSNNYKQIGWETGWYCSHIIDDILSQIQTRYILINDGDVVFYDKFLENHINTINKYDVIGIISDLEFITDVDYNFLNYWGWNNILTSDNNGYFRIVPFHLFLDRNKLKNITFDRIRPSWKEAVEYLDLGADFLSQLLYKQKKIYSLNNIYEKFMHHFTFISSSKRLKDEPIWKKSLRKEEIKNINNNKKLLHILEKYNFNIQRIC